MERFIDPEGRFEPGDRRRLDRAFNRFEKRFPQTRLHLCLTRLPDNADCREFGYWLFNICQPRTQEEEARRYHGVLFVIDRRKRAASVTLGYGLDPFIDDASIKRLLAPSKAQFQDGDYIGGVLRFLKGLDRKLRIACVSAQEDAAAWASVREHAPAKPAHTDSETDHDHIPHPVTDVA